MRAAILSIGDELLEGAVADRNARWIARQLFARGVSLVETRVAGDDRDAIALAARELAGRCDALLVSGGLGRTADDLTRAALLELVRGARVLPNSRGTEPGLAGMIGGCSVIVMPGPPAEMRSMFLEHGVRELGLQGAIVQRSLLVHEFGLGETAADERLRAIGGPLRGLRVGITVRASLVSARLRAQGPPEELDTKLASARAAVERAWAPYAYGAAGETLASATLSLLRRAGRSLSTAESCTGGWLGKLIVDVPGSSDQYRGGWITYSNELKVSCLGVSPEILERDGAVSAPCALAMAAGALRYGCDEALAVTGIAGPSGGTRDKPVGTVFIALARHVDGGPRTLVRRFLFPGTRGEVRDRAAKAALQVLRFALLGADPAPKLLWEAPAEAPVLR